MTYTVPPLLQASSFGASAKNKRRKINSTSSSATRLATSKETGRSGAGAAKSSLGSQITKTSDDGSEVSTSSSSNLFVIDKTRKTSSRADSHANSHNLADGGVKTGHDLDDHANMGTVVANYPSFTQAHEEQGETSGGFLNEEDGEEIAGGGKWRSAQEQFEEIKRRGGQKGQKALLGDHVDPHPARTRKVERQRAVEEHEIAERGREKAGADRKAAEREKNRQHVEELRAQQQARLDKEMALEWEALRKKTQADQGTKSSMIDGMKHF